MLGNAEADYAFPLKGYIRGLEMLTVRLAFVVAAAFVVAVAAVKLSALMFS
jgi:hypothetical protein